MEKYTIRRFEGNDACEVSALAAKTLRTVNIKDYTAEYIEETIKSLSPEIISERASHAHMYVVCNEKKIVGCGAIDGYWGSTTESILLTVFVLPEYQGRGIGTRIIKTLEEDEFFLRADRIEIPASITAVEFYRRFDYDYKNGVTAPDEDGICRLEKFR